MPTSLPGIAKKAREQKKHRFQNLIGMLDETYLLDCWRYIRKNAAAGVDRISAWEYEKTLTANISGLVEKLKRGTYRARLIRRQYIPKGDGKFRPLGIPTVEDKLLQLAVARILSSIYEEDFQRCSYGYRPNVGARDAVDKLTVKLQFGPYTQVVEADIKGFFDNIDHSWLIRMLEERIDDRRLLALIVRWLKAGILDTDGKVINPATGTPQGGIISPILANVYLHYGLDLWFQRVVKQHCKGEACLVRYADDFVCGFEYERDAERFYSVLGKRLAKFGLTLSPEKTRVIPMPRGESKASFEFLGFEFRWGKDRGGKPHLKRRTAPRKQNKALAAFTQWCREIRHAPIAWIMERFRAKLNGYYNYFRVVGNLKSLRAYHFYTSRILFGWMNRRSQRKSYNWVGFEAMLRTFNIPTPRMTAGA